MSRRIWVWKRVAISGFLAVHLAAIVVWNLPFCAIRVKTIDLAIKYIYPLGLWQNWTMFAPNPIQNTLMLEALAVDKNGMLYNFAFPKMADFSIAQGVPRVRHSKFSSYFASDEFPVLREVGARHVVRSLNLPPEVFPVEVELRFVVRETPPAGTVPDPMAPTRILTVKQYLFPTWEEARP